MYTIKEANIKSDSFNVTYISYISCSIQVTNEMVKYYLMTYDLIFNCIKYPYNKQKFCAYVCGARTEGAMYMGRTKSFAH